ncbi:hypothetical protein ACFE04_004204 [Oxalis oulophora]
MRWSAQTIHFASSDDGRYLISFNRNHQELVVYRPTWLSYSCNEEYCTSHDFPSKAKIFESFFTQMYCVSLASSNELICKDFFIYMESNQFRLFATSSSQIQDALHLTVLLEDGMILLDKKVFSNDFINLAHNMGVFLFDDMLAIVSLRYQTIHIIQIRDSGNLVYVRAIGAFCREDDELFLNCSSQASDPVFDFCLA